MDAKKITEDYHDWHNIAELRLLGLSRSQIAKKLQLPPGRVMRLSRLNVDELLQHGNRPRPSYSCRLDPYEESVKHLLITCPYYSSTQIHEYLKENNPSFPKVCEKTVFNYVKKIRKRYDVTPCVGVWIETMPGRTPPPARPWHGGSLSCRTSLSDRRNPG